MKRFLVMILLVLILFSIVPGFSSAASTNTVKMSLAEVQEKFPNGKYWNHADSKGSANNNPNGWSDTPCTHGSHTSLGNNATCNFFATPGTSVTNEKNYHSAQCRGFANQVTYDIYGKPWTDGHKGGQKDLSKLKPGDVVFYKTSNPLGHAVFVTGVNGTTITFGDANGDGVCGIRWNVKMSDATISKITDYRSAPFALPGAINNNTFKQGETPTSYGSTNNSNNTNYSTSCRDTGNHISYNSSGYCKECGTEYPITVTPLLATANTINDNVPVRARPYAPDTILAKLPKGATVSITGFGNNSVGNLWYRVDYLNQTRWVFSGNLTTPRPDPNGTVSIQYNANGGSGAPASHTTLKDSYGVATFTLSTTRPTRSGYAFIGWRLDNSTAYDIDSPGQDIAISLGNPSGNDTLTYYAQWSASPILTVSASANRTSGTTSDKYSYTVTTNVPATKITYSFSGNSTLYTLNANGTNNFNSGSGSVSADKKTWTWSNDTLAAGNRTITITAYDADGNTASTTLSINVTAPTATAITVSASANRTSGKTSDKYSYTVTTNVPATKITYSFSGNSTLYTLNANGTNNFNSGSGSVSADKKTWTWTGDTLSAGNRTITITAYDANGNTASTTLNINVSK